MEEKGHLDWLYKLVSPSDEEQQLTIADAVFDVYTDVHGDTFLGQWVVWHCTLFSVSLSVEDMHSLFRSFDRSKLCLPESVQKLESRLYFICLNKGSC